ncbi:MAG: hypothetical protein ACLGIY_04085, partial [Betaproteobacteria bacterium]
TSIGWGCPDSHDLKLSNRPVRIRMPGGVGGAQSTMTVPYPDLKSPRHAGSRPSVLRVAIIGWKVWIAASPR